MEIKIKKILMCICIMICTLQVVGIMTETSIWAQPSEGVVDTDEILDDMDQVIDDIDYVVNGDEMNDTLEELEEIALPSFSTTTASAGTSKRQKVVSFAKKFVGNKYRWGGTSLTHGTDCSGFTQSVYKHFGYRLPRTSSSQRHAGTGVRLSQRKVGDLICYSGHVAIYIGNNKIVHASNSKPYPRGGIKISSMYIKQIKAVRRIIK